MDHPPVLASDLKGTVIVGVGVPGCGKTTYLKPLSRELDMAYVNPDEVRQEATGDASDHSKEPVVWKKVHAYVTQNIGRGVVVDATYTRARDRRELIQLCKKEGAKRIIAYWFDVPFDVCKARNAARDRIVPEAALEKMHNRLVANPPRVDEGFTEVVIIRG